MVKKTLTTIILLLVCFLLPLTPVEAEYESIYHYYIEEGLEAFYQEDFEDALFYFKTAHAIDPSRQQPLQYLNLIKREQEGRLTNSGRTPKPRSSPSTLSEPVLTNYQRLVSRTTEQAMAEILQDYPSTASDSAMQNSIDQAVKIVKSDTSEIFAEDEWSKVKMDATAAVVKRVERLKVRNEGMVPVQGERIEVVGDTANSLESMTSIEQEPAAIEAVKVDLEPSPPIISPLLRPEPEIEAVSSVSTAPFKPSSPLSEQTERSYTITDPTGSQRRFFDNEEFRLNDDLWADHRTLTLELEIGKSVIFSGTMITRYLATLQDLLEISRINKDRILVKAVKRGNTILYVWDDRGRWTFNVRCVYPFESTKETQRMLNQELVRPFKFGYTNSWSTLHKGPKLSGMTQENLIFTNWIGLSGQTPYGDFDGSINTYRFPQSTEIVGQRIGLNNGNIGPFKDFRIRGYDVFKSLSELTMTGRNFRGVALDSYAFQHKIAYSYFHGQDKSISIFSNDGNVRQQESYVEGFKLILNPDQQDDQYAFNYARGYGEARTVGLKDEAYSLSTKRQFKEFDIYGEVGYDRDEVAEIIQATKEREDLDVGIFVRDIPAEYQTVFGAPTNSGQVGASLNMSIKPREHRWDGFLDLYRDRAQPNEDNPNLVNMDLSTSYSKMIDDMSSWAVSFGYINTPQTLAPRQFLQTGASYSKNIKVGELRYLSLSLGQNFQWSRYDDSPTSDYDRYSLRAGMRYKLFKNLFSSLSYEYIVVRDVFNNEWNTPGALQAGLNYSTPIAKNLSLSFDLSYRNEENTEGNFSFLAGEDSVSKTLSLTYNPADDISLYMDSQFRRVWPHDTVLSPAYYDWNFMLGLRAEWDLPFRWNPTGEIQGVVYKDYNGNSLQDKNEPGMAGIKVIAGKYETKTNENGEYTIRVSAKKVNVSLDLKTIPSGFVFSTALSRDVLVEHKKAQRVNFGLTSRSGIYGVAFVDTNGSGRPDRGDKFVSNIVVRLGSGDITKTDYSGSYFFENINPGKHKIKIDVTSIPLTYSPTIKIETDITLDEGMTYVHNIPLKENPAATKP